MEDLYNSIIDIAEAVKTGDFKIIIDSIKIYVQRLSAGHLDFMDDFIDNLDKKVKKLANYSRVM
jgi:hypothetical protein